MRAPYACVLAAFVAACGFTPTTLEPVDAARLDGSAAGSGSGSGSGSAACPDGDDDLDGICNSVDDWQCGVKPTDLNANGGEITIQGSWGSQELKLNNANTRLVSVHPGQSFGIGFDYDLYEGCTITTHCRIELEIGTDKAGKSGCVWDADVTGGPGNIGHASGTWTSTLSFSQPDIYQVRLMPVFAGSCTPDWAFLAPDANATVALVCVH